MSDSGQETEAKFYVQDLKRIRNLLEELKAHLIQPRVLEKNIRFDLPDGSLASEKKVLRLRYDTAARLTYKSAGNREQGVLSRQEIEFVAEDFEKAKRFLEALGYQQIFYYEKFRATYELPETSGASEDLGGLVHVMLDELPYGKFVEIEGETEKTIHALADKLNLNWEAAIERSYSSLFEHIQQSMKLPFRDLSFPNFAGLKVDAFDLGVRAADR